MKGKTNNPNGRPKGVPNRATSDLKAFVQKVLEDNQQVFIEDLQAIEPEKRLAILEKLMNFCIPKMQSVSVEAQINAEYIALEKLLETAPQEAIEQISIRILELRERNENE